ncbi:MAG: RluA family pseudouridine synthase [Candidatus Omnitrophica bacterium]|nr:RluA family pseudouridine synthase [Candidatus Omnitrophota bacterium]
MSKKFISTRPIKILHEDEHLIAFFKPANLLTVATDKGKETQTLDQLVNAQFAARPGALDGVKLHPCHRLDRDTSGVILFAKGHRAEELMMELFRQKLVKKKYIAFVHGRLQNVKGEIRSRLEEDRFSKDPEMISVTRYQLKQQRKRFAVVEVEPLTGRTNQIRIHFKGLGYPLVGENKFIFRKDMELRFKRTALHAHELYFKHPMTGVPVSITAPLSVDMQNFLDKNKT